VASQQGAHKSRFHAGLAIVAACALGGACLAAADARKEEKSTTLRNLNPVSIFSPDENRHILDLERPPGRRADDSEPEVHTIYFPPNPPPLGIELSLRAVDDRVGAPLELAPYVLEPFYAPLSTRLIERSLTRKQEQQLADYVARKSERLRELRARLAELAAVGPELRLLALEEFADRQASALAALELEADGLRLQFYTQPMASSAGSWYEWRGWKLGRGRLDLPRDQTFFFEGQLLRGAAFYQEGLSPVQRELLRECAIELESLVFSDAQAAAPSAHEWFWFFSPHLARVHLPEDLPPDVQEKVAAFRTEKAALKAELRDAVYEQDRALFASSRAAPLAALAAAQESQLVELEKAAEDIRRRLAVVAPQPVPPLPPPLPAELSGMIDAYTREKKTLERELAECVRRAVRHMQVPVSYDVERSALTWHAARLEAIDRARERWRNENADRVDALKQKLEALRAAVEVWAGPAAREGPRGVTGSFLRDFFNRRSEQQGRHECHLAVFEPGLSPEQRRLLFEAGVVALNLPLPGPEEQPTSLPGTILK
jgi:hypothetical protein